MQACRIYCHFTTWHKNCTAQVQVKPLDRSKGFTLHPLTDLFIPTPNRLLWEAFWPRSNYARTLFAHILLLRPIARYSFKQLSELGHREDNENAQTSMQRGFKPGLSRLRVRHSTAEPPRSTQNGCCRALSSKIPI